MIVMSAQQIKQNNLILGFSFLSHKMKKDVTGNDRAGLLVLTDTDSMSSGIFVRFL